VIEEIRELWRFRELLIVLTQRELRVRYKNSALGFLWSFINPLVTTFVMWLVFGKMLGNGVDNFSAYVLAAYLPFTFFQFAVLDSAQSILAALPIVRKVYFPRETLPLATILGNFVHLLIGYGVFFLYLFAVYAASGFRENPYQLTTWLLPFLMLISLCFAAGMGLLVSALNTFYEDVKYVTSVVMYLLFYLCPIVYFHETVAKKLEGDTWLFRLYMLNPQAVLSVAYRKALLAGVKIPVTIDKIPYDVQPSPMPWTWIGYAAVVSVLTLAFGYHVFNRVKWRFVERP
jgi:lipopolysaccharide transport system permease protein